jgi:hypothetical protein
MKPQKLRAAHVTLKGDRCLVVSAWKVIQPTGDGARVTFSSSKFETARPKATRAGVLAALGERRAA